MSTSSSALRPPPPNPPKLASPSQLASMEESTKQGAAKSKVNGTSQDCPLKKSWFSVTIVHDHEGTEKVVEGLTVNCHVPDLGPTAGVTSSGSPHVRFDDLDPGGTGDVLSTSHSDEVWEVVTDIS